jgi:glucose-1-phosphate thymidylyltransferase
MVFAIETLAMDDDIMVIAGDNLFTFDLCACYKFYKMKQADCIIAKEIDDYQALKSFAVATLDTDGKVLALCEKPENPQSNTAVFAVYCYKRDTLPLIRQYLYEGNNSDAPGYFVQWLYSRRAVYAYVMDGDCYDVGTPEAYELVQTLEF